MLSFSPIHAILTPIMPGAKLGQHWLNDKHVAEKIADAAALSPGDTCIEIGGGKGSLTRWLIPLCKRLIVYEIDSNWASHLFKFAKSWGGHTEIRELDALKIEWNRTALEIPPPEPLVIVGNLPYYITSSLFLRIAYSRLDFKHAVFLIQKEVADRIASNPGDSEYSRLTVSLGAFLETTKLFDVPADAFKPRPKVKSTLIRMTPVEQPLVDTGLTLQYEHTVKAAFHMRRKTIKNNLLAGFPDIKPVEIDNILDCMGVKPGARAQELSIQQFVTLTRMLDDSQK